MKVVYVSSLEAGGPVTHLLDLAPRVAAAGVDVVVVCANDQLAGELRQRGVPAVTVAVRTPTDVAGALRLRPHLKGADVVHTQDRRAGLLARPQAALAGAAVVHTLHGLPDRLSTSVVPADKDIPAVDDAGLADRVRLRAEALLSRIGVTVVPSHALARFLAARGFPGDRLRVIPNAVAVRRGAPMERDGALVVGTAAVLKPHKGIDVLIDASARVTGDLRLEIFGDGPSRGELEARAREAGIPVRFHGYVADASSRFGELDVFALASWAENLPMAILEAMAWALPVVATRVGGVPELVVDRVTGLLVEPGDRDGLAAALETLCRDRPLRTALGTAGAQRVSAEFDSGAIASRMVALYEELVRARGSS
jgi:glycosyltransferase involved in cell wall biosynthesis